LTHELQTQLATAPFAKKLRELDSQKKEIFEQKGGNVESTAKILGLKKKLKIQLKL